jgi:hypothetical protein
VTVLVPVTDPVAFEVAVTVYVPGVVVYSEIVQGAATAEVHGLVPTKLPPEVVQVTVLLLTPVTTALIV